MRETLSNRRLSNLFLTAANWNSSFASCFASVELFLWKCFFFWYAVLVFYISPLYIAVSFQRGAWVLISAKIRYSSWWISSPSSLVPRRVGPKHYITATNIYGLSIYFPLCYAMLLQKRKICGKKIILSISALNFENNRKKKKKQLRPLLGKCGIDRPLSLSRSLEFGVVILFNHW